MIEMRNMLDDDRAEVLEMMHLLYDSPAVYYPVSEAARRRDLDDCVGVCPFVEGVVFADKESGALAGYAILSKSYSTEYGGVCVWIEDLFLRESYRRQGLGKRFFAYLAELYPDAVRFRLEAEPENRSALAFYRKCGFEEVPYLQLHKVSGEPQRQESEQTI